MSVKRTLTMMARDLKLGGRSLPIMGVFVMPILITAMIQLDRPVPSRTRLGIVDRGRSRITSALDDMDGMLLTRAASVAELKRLVESHELEAGLVLGEGFDARVRAGERPGLEFYVSGGTSARTRLVLAVTTIALAREIAGSTAPVDVRFSKVKKVHGLDYQNFKVLFWLMFLLTTAGIWVPALLLAEERERGTLRAILVTPASVSETVISKAVLALIMTAALCYLTLLLNMALPARPGALLVTAAVSAVICTELGLVIGTLARDIITVAACTMALQALTCASLACSLMLRRAPWITKLVPTYWVVGPLYEVAVNGAGFEHVWWELAISGALVAAMAVAIVLLGRRMGARLATE